MKQRSKVQRPAPDQSKIQQPPVTPAASTPLRLDPLPRSGALLFVVAACFVCLGYTLYTNQTWEDSLITLRQAENLINGDGLTYNPGGLVHGFTSPINVL